MGIKKLASIALRKPVFAGLAPADKKKNEMDGFNTPQQLKQHFALVEAKQRLSCLTSFLKQKIPKTNEQACKIVLFVSTRETVECFYLLFNLFNKTNLLKPEENPEGKPNKRDDNTERDKKASKKRKLAEKEAAMEATRSFEEGGFEFLEYFDISVFKLHGEMAQADRTTCYTSFKSNPRALLITTDVAARGLDLPDINWIIQYDPPSDSTDYVHRVGRTARMGKLGNALLFLLHTESAYVKYLQDMGLQLQNLALNYDQDMQLNFERYVEASPYAKKRARKAFVSSIRAYTTHTSTTKHIFRVSELHLGHVAKSFALRETPSESLNIYRSTNKREDKKDKMEKK
jgi:ATP-dependent RNA helicase DDX31/DBP7